jgi:hypothetical protein
MPGRDSFPRIDSQKFPKKEKIAVLKANQPGTLSVNKLWRLPG